MKLPFAHKLSFLKPPASKSHSQTVRPTPQEHASVPAESVAISQDAENPIPPANLRPSEQAKIGLKGALDSIGGLFGVVLTKAIKGRKSPMMTAAWEDLLVASYEVPKEALEPYLPEGVELDSWGGKHYMSLVGLKTKKIKGLGVPVPGGQDMEQVNLRFYTKRDTPDGEKKGVVFIKQVVPSQTVAWASRALVNENVVAGSMSHKLPEDTQDGEVSYKWSVNGSSSQMSAQRSGEAKPLVEGSKEEFLLENYFGFSTQQDGRAVEYKVEHPAWKTYEVKNPKVEVDAEALYGKDLAKYLSGPPSSVVIVDGSATAVHTPRTVD